MPNAPRADMETVGHQMQGLFTKAVCQLPAGITSRLSRPLRQAVFLAVFVAIGGLGCTAKFFRLSTDAWVADGGCAGTLRAELLESTGTGFEDRSEYRLRSVDLPQGKELTLQLRKADGFVAENQKVFVGEEGVIPSVEEGKAVDLVLRFSKMLPNEPVGVGVVAADGSCARTVIVPRGEEGAARK